MTVHKSHKIHRRTLRAPVSGIPAAKSLKGTSHQVLGTHKIAAHTTYPLKKLPLRGEPKKFVKRLSPTAQGSGGPSGWKKAHGFHFKTRLRMLKTKRRQLGHWSRAKRGDRPR